MQISVKIPATGPVTFGVGMPKGATAPSQSWRLVDPNGLVLATQTRALDVWADGSVRWLLVDTIVPSGQNRGDWVLEQGDAPGVSAAIRVTERLDAISIDTGAAQFELGPGIAPFGAGLFVTDSIGNEKRATFSSVRVEDRGSIRTVAVLAGGVDAGHGRHLALTVRIHFFAGLGSVRLFVTLTNPDRAVHEGGFWDLGDAGSILIKDASFRLSSSAAIARVRVSTEVSAAPVDLDAPVNLYQDSSGGEQWRSTNHLTRDRVVPTTFQGYRLRSSSGERSGRRATPAVSVGSIGMSVPEFWENFPQAISVKDRSLTWSFWPGQFAALHELQGGEQKTFECRLFFGAGDQALEPWARSQSTFAVSPDWTLASGAVPFLAPLSADHLALVNSAVDGANSFDGKREIIDQFGWRHFGEIYGDHESIRQKSPPIVSHYNNQYDPVAGFIYQFFRTGDARWWRMADELARHVIDVDVYHTDRDKSAYNHGLFWHTYHYGDADLATHRTYPRSAKGRTHGGGPSADHNYTTGLMLHYFLTGSAASRETVIDLGRFVIALDDGRKTPFRWLDTSDTGRAILSNGYYGPGRGPANSLNALVDAYRLSGEAPFLTKADQVVRRVVHPNDDIARHRLDDPEERWFYTMFLQSLGKYLHAKVERGDLDEPYAYGRASLLHYAEWMERNEHPYLEKPEKLEFPTETWAAQDIRKSDVFHYAALHATDPDAKRRFDERARFFHSYSVGTLQGMATRALARPVIVLTTSGFLQGWRNGHAGASEPPPAGKHAFGRQTVFEPQRSRAMRKAKRAVPLVLGAAALIAAIWMAL